MNLSVDDLPLVILDVSPTTDQYVVGTNTGKVLVVSTAMYRDTRGWEWREADCANPARMWDQNALVRVPVGVPSFTLPIAPSQGPVWEDDSPSPTLDSETVYPARRTVRLADGTEVLTRLMAWAPRSRKWCVWEQGENTCR